jgi:hypothetical protein
MQCKGLDFINPVPLIDPRRVAAQELAGEKHFSGWTLAYQEHEKSFNKWDRFRGWLAGD